MSPPSSSSPLEQASKDLRLSRLVINKLGETFDNFQLHSCSILNLAEQWRNLQTNFTTVNSSLEKRVTELELKEREANAAANRLRNLQEEIELRRRKVEAGEVELSHKIEQVELRQKEVARWLEWIEREKKGIGVRCKVAEAKEREVAVTLRRVKAVDEEESRVREGRAELESREKRVELREEKVEERCSEVVGRERVINEREKALEAREKGLDDRGKEMELLEGEMRERVRVMELREREMDELYEALESKGKDIDERCKVVESKERVLDAREEEFKVQCEAIESKEKDVNELFTSLEVKEKVLDAREKELKVQCEAMESKEKGVNEWFASLEAKEKVLGAREEELKVHFEAIESKEKGVNECFASLEAKENVFDAREKELKVQCEAIESREKEVDQRFAVFETKEKDFEGACRAFEEKGQQLNKLCQMLELKENEINERMHVVELEEKRSREQSKELELKEKQVNEHLAGLKLKDKHIDEHYKTMDSKEKETEEFPKRDKLKGMQLIKDSQRSSELEEKQIVECDQVLALKQTNDNCKVVHPQTGDGLQKSEEKTSVESNNNNIVVNNDKGDNNTMRFRVTNGKSLQIFLNERVNEHGSIRKRLIKMLNQSSKPAKLVLDALEGFYPPHLSKDGVTFETSVIKSSCLLLLETLLDIKPVISKALRVDARKVAVIWRGKIGMDEESEIIGFLLFVVSYNLITFFQKKDFRALVDRVDEHRLTSRLRQRLGLRQRFDVSRSSKHVTKKPSQSDTIQKAGTLGSSSTKTSGDIHSLCRDMNADAVRSYLIEHVQEHDILRDKILDALKNASDPAKLVLDVCQSSAADPDKIRANDNSSSCIFLMEQFMKLSSSISPEVKDEAINFATFLKARLKGNCFCADHFRFLKFLAAYKLAHIYSADDLLSHFEVFYCEPEVYQPEQNTHLCLALGLAKKIPGVIKSLIDQNKQLLAVKYICSFKLERSFPPAPLLEAYLVLKKGEGKLKEGSFKEKVDAENAELTALQNVLKCISNFKLESQLPTGPMLSRIKELERAKESRKTAAKVLKKRAASPSSSISSPSYQEKRPRIGTFRKVQPVSHMCMRRHPGPPSVLRPFRPPVAVMLPPNWPNPHFNASVGNYAVAGPGHFVSAQQYHVGAPISICRGHNQARTRPNQGQF